MILRRLTLLLWCIYAVLWTGGLIAGGVSNAAPLMAPLFLVLAGVLAVLENRSNAAGLLLGAGIGFAAEVVGVRTGLPFGHYRYTEVLAPSILGVPFAIPFAWLILIDFVRGITRSALVGGLIMTAIDLVIDPLAAGPLAYWQWLDHGPYFGIPTLNFAGWFVVSTVILQVAFRGRSAQAGQRALAGWSVIAFFTALAAIKGMWIPALIGVTLTCVTLVLRLRRRSVTFLPSETPSRGSPGYV